jgi:DNA primase
MEHEKYSYVEALRWLAQKYNIEVEETETSPEYRQIQQTSDSLYIVNQFAQRFFTDQLFDSEEGQDIALSYLRERGLKDETIRTFQLGYNPAGWDSFTKAALAAQYNLDILQKSGLVTVRDGEPRDNYRGRIIFPVHNQSGKVLGFGARIIGKAEKGPKYINTPENEIYIKSRILYGSWFARHAIDRQDECLLVEGYTDVISLHQAGIENVVASGGTSLTADQLRLVRKYTTNLPILYDGDAAGVKAALRGLDLALEEGLHVKLVLLPDQEDPDSYVNKVGTEAFRSFIDAHKKDVILFQIEVMMKDAGQDSVKKASVVNQIAESISRLNKAEDFTRQQDYIQRCSELMKIDEQGLTALVNKFIREKITRDERREIQAGLAQEETAGSAQVPEEDGLELLFRDEINERAMVRALLEFGLKPWDESRTVADYLFEEIERDNLSDLIDNKQLLRIIDIYKTWYREGLEPTPRQILYHEDRQVSGLAVSLMDTSYELSPKWKIYYDGPLPSREDLYKQEVESCMTYLKLRKIKRLINENQRDLEKNPDAAGLITLLQTHRLLKEMEIELTSRIGTVIFK